MDLRIVHALKKINCETCKLTVISFGRAAKLCKDIGCFVFTRETVQERNIYNGP